MKPFELESGTFINLEAVREFNPKYSRITYIFGGEYTFVSPEDKDKLIAALKPKRQRKATTE